MKELQLEWATMGTDLQTLFVLAVGFFVACGAGYLAERLKLSPVLGYLVGGFLIGPNSPGIVIGESFTDQLALIGITLLMFAVGLNFDWKDLIKVRRIVLPGALILAILSIGGGTLIGLFEGEALLSGFVIGLAICVSSTVVIVRLLTDRQLLQREEGHIVMGWTLVEDLISVFGLILLPALIVEGESNLSFSVGIALFKILLLALFIHFIGGRIVEALLKAIARQKSHELFTLAILASVFTIAIGSAALFGVSIALGAFIAGTVVGKTKLSHQAAANALPMRDAFSVIFFLSVGMLFNPPAIWNHPRFFLLLLAVILLVRPVAAFLIAKVARLSNYTSMALALAIAQIGEYSFILAEEGSRLHILPDVAYDLIVGAAFVSIGLSPLLFHFVSPLRFASGNGKEVPPEPEIPHSFLPKAVVVGFGPVGRAAAEELQKTHSVIVIDQNIDTVISHIGAEILLFGDARQMLLLERAGAANAQLAVISTPDWRITQEVIKSLLEMNPYMDLIARAPFERDLERLKRFGIPIVCDETESSKKIRSLIRTQLKRN